MIYIWVRIKWLEFKIYYLEGEGMVGVNINFFYAIIDVL